MLSQQEPNKKQPAKRGLGRGLASLLPAAFDEILPAQPGMSGQTPAPTAARSVATTPPGAMKPGTQPGMAVPGKPMQEGVSEKRLGLPAALTESRPPKAQATNDDRPYFFVDLADVNPNPDQPRRHFDKQALDELAQSIRVHGILSPIVVRRKALGFEIIAGERRWRAAKLAGLAKIPVLLKEIGEKAQYQLALIENIQRQDLNAIEEAMAYQHLMDVYTWTQEKVAEQVGKERSSVANTLRLLKLPQSVVDLINEGKLGAGHAKALLGLTNPDEIKNIARLVVDEGWSVRTLENHVRSGKQTVVKPLERTPEADVQMRDLSRRLESRFKVKVELAGTRSKGSIRIHFRSTAELNRLVELLESPR